MTPQPSASLDRTALDFAQSWHEHPSVRSLLEYHGVNLGQADEYAVYMLALTTLASRTDSAAP